MSCPNCEQCILSQPSESPQHTFTEVDCITYDPDEDEFFSEAFLPTGTGSASPALGSDEPQSITMHMTMEDILRGCDSRFTASDFNYEGAQTQTLSPLGEPTDGAIDEGAAFQQFYEDLDGRQYSWAYSYEGFLNDYEIAQPNDGSSSSQPPIPSRSIYPTIDYRQLYSLLRERPPTPPPPYREPEALRHLDIYISCRYDIPPDFPPVQSNDE